MQKKKNDFFNITNLFNTKSTVIMGFMIALTVVLDQYSIYLTPTFKAIGFSYLPGVIIATLYGPWGALAFGFVCDTVRFLANPRGNEYFFGYALSEMLTCFIYACFLYRKPIHFWRVFAARLLTIILVTFCLNFVWTSMMSGGIASKYFTTTRIINNLVQLPFHAILTTFMLQYMMKVPVIRSLIQPSENT